MFEQQLIECRRQKGDGKRWLSLPASMVIHAAVVGLAVGATLWSVDDLSDPPIPVSLYVAAPAPAVPVGRTQSPSSRPPSPPPEHHTQQQVVAPSEIPAQVPEPLEAPEPQESTGSGEGVDGGVGEDWGGGGGVGVLGPLKEQAAEEPEQAPTVVRANVDLKEPRRLVEIKPIYPEPARKAHIEGVVILEVIVDTRGAVRDVRVLRPMPLGMTEAAEDAVRRWRWEPATLNGRPVEVYITVTVRFTLR
jgi:protein TonB